MTTTLRSDRVGTWWSVPSWRQPVLTMAATLASWLTSRGIAAEAGLASDVIVLGAVLPVTLAQLISRRAPVSRAERLTRLVAVPVVALAATEVGILI